MTTRTRAAAMPRVAVAGAGIGGLAAALALARAGCRVEVVERATALLEIGAGVQLSPNATRVLRDLGLLDPLLADAVAIEELAIGRGRDAAPLARMKLGEEAARRYGAPFLVILRADLQRALLGAVASEDAIVLRTGASLRGWSETSEGMGLDLADVEPLCVDALVGADGVGSAVAAALAGPRAPDIVRRHAWRATIPLDRLPPAMRASRSQLWLGPAAHLVHYPVAAGRLLNVVAAVDDEAREPGPDPSWSREGDPRDLRRRFAGWHASLRALLDAAPDWRRWPLVERPPAARWSAGPVTLLGDAAHPMLPFLAQGAAQALEDAAALGDAVATHPGDLAAAFAVYEARRRPRAERVVAQSRRQAALYHLAGPAAVARDVVLRLTPPARLLARYDWLYGPAPQRAR